jgi:type II secretory pathway pseudopilin PulG
VATRLRLRLRLRAEAGFGLVELTMAMVMLNVGILAVVAAFNSGALALRRASALGNASTIADQQMEHLRALRNCQIYLTAAQMPGLTSTYANDTGSYQAAGSYYSSSTPAASQNWLVDANDTTWSAAHSPLAAPTSCPGTGLNPHQTIVGPDNRSYVVDTYLFVIHLGTGGWQKQATIVVRDPNASTLALVRESSAFDPSSAP